MHFLTSGSQSAATFVKWGMSPIHTSDYPSDYLRVDFFNQLHFSEPDDFRLWAFRPCDPFALKSMVPRKMGGRRTAIAVCQETAHHDNDFGRPIRLKRRSTLHVGYTQHARNKRIPLCSYCSSPITQDSLYKASSRRGGHGRQSDPANVSTTLTRKPPHHGHDSGFSFRFRGSRLPSLH
jgi:hypothetical protein